MSFATPGTAPVRPERLGRLGLGAVALRFDLGEAIAAAAVRLTGDELHWLEHGGGPVPFEREPAWTA